MRFVGAGCTCADLWACTLTLFSLSSRTLHSDGTFDNACRVACVFRMRRRRTCVPCEPFVITIGRVGLAACLQGSMQRNTRWHAPGERRPGGRLPAWLWHSGQELFLASLQSLPRGCLWSESWPTKRRPLSRAAKQRPR